MGCNASTGGQYAPTLRYHDGTFYVIGTNYGGKMCIRDRDGNAWAPCIEEKLVGDQYKYFFYYSGNPKAGGG